nr:MAG TPA: hypothetical protein [Caudoviricetes sp.]DAU71183.1 MAG TPA: hypothetical protein [Caudoviricetes sp.]
MSFTTRFAYFLYTTFLKSAPPDFKKLYPL